MRMLVYWRAFLFVVNQSSTETHDNPRRQEGAISDRASDHCLIARPYKQDDEPAAATGQAILADNTSSRFKRHKLRGLWCLPDGTQVSDRHCRE